MEKINLTKLIAENSPYSRRQAEKLIREGLVEIDNRPAKLGEKANSISTIRINGKKLIGTDKKVYIKLNKPGGYVCTNRFFKGEKNIFSLIDVSERLFSLGRLDKDSCGLIILTNDGNLTYKLTHPKFEHDKVYLVKLKNDSRLKENDFIKRIIGNFKKGLNIGEKTLAKAQDIKKIKETEFEIILSEGKKRQIREMFRVFGLEVEFLKRTDFAGIKLGNLKEGQWVNLTREEIEILKED
jgi:pseudouridine synthase